MKPVAYERAWGNGCWLMLPDSEGRAIYEQRYHCPADADRAVHDFNRRGAAYPPEHYARLRRKAGR